VVFQAYITLTFCRRKNANLAAIVLDLILRIHDCILPSKYAFSTRFGCGVRTCDFLLMHDRSLAASYVEESGYRASARAVPFIVINFIFASIRVTEFNVPAEPFIKGCIMTMVAFVFPILNGEMNSTTLQTVASQEPLGLEEKKIGFRVLSTEQPDIIGKWLNPKAEIFVCFWNIHFFVVKTTPRKRQLLKWNCQEGESPSAAHRGRSTGPVCEVVCHLIALPALRPESPLSDKMVSDFKSLTDGVGMFRSRMAAVKLQLTFTVKRQPPLTVKFNHL
jgi:hypothetical protein